MKLFLVLQLLAVLSEAAKACADGELDATEMLMIATGILSAIGINGVTDSDIWFTPKEDGGLRIDLGPKLVKIFSVKIKAGNGI